MNIATYYKEADAITTYGIDWSQWLDGRTISASSWDVPAGITNVDDANTTTTTSIQLSGGTWGESYVLTNTVTLNTTDVEERSITIKIQQEQKYCTPAEVRRRMSGGSGSGGSATITALPEAELDALIEQASRMFDLACGVTPGYFGGPPFPFATEQTVYGDGTNYLRLDPYVPGSLNATITLPDGYTVPTFVERDGYLILASNGVLPPFNSFYNCYWPGWYSGVAVTVSAIWGFESTPADVKLAVIELVINLKRETDPADVKLVDLEGQPLRETLPPRVREIAKKYRPKTGVAFV